MARLRLQHSSSGLGLLAFLRRRRGKHRLDGALRIVPESAVERLETGLCYLCGDLIEQALYRLGSPRCHDCRGHGAATDLRADSV